MPKYEARCLKCGTIHEYVRRVQHCMDTPECCGEKALKVITSAPMGVVRGRFEPFRSMVDGSIISTTAEMREHNKRNNVACLADGYSDEVVRSGNFGRVEKSDPVETKQDVAEAIQMINAGYTPQRREDHAH